MRTVDSLRVLAELSASQWGLFTAAQARFFGVPCVDAARLAEAGHVGCLAHGVYKAVGAPGDEFEQLRAAWLSTDPSEFTTARRRQSQRSELYYRVRPLASALTVLVQGLPATTIERTISDLLEARTDLGLMRQTIADAVRRQELDLDELAKELGPASWPGFPAHDPPWRLTSAAPATRPPSTSWSRPTA